MKAGEELLGRHAFFAVGFVKRFQKFGLLSRRKLNDLRLVVVVSSHNRNDGSLRQGQPFDNDLAIDDGASGKLHTAMVRQRQ